MPFAFAGCGADAGFALNPFGRVPCGFVCAGAGAGFGFGADSALKPFGIVPLDFAGAGAGFVSTFGGGGGGGGACCAEPFALSP